MRNLANLFQSLVIPALIMSVGTGCKTTSKNALSQMSTVIGISGHARYHDGRSEIWRDIKLGDHIPQDSMIQTANGPGNAIALAIGARAANLNNRLRRANQLILYGNSILKLDRITAKTVAGKKISDIRLFLPEGSALCDFDMDWPTDTALIEKNSSGSKVTAIKPRPDTSYYEISSSNVVIHAEHAIFFFAPSKATSIARGAVALEFTDTGLTKDLFASQTYDFATGEVSHIETRPNPDAVPGPVWEWLRPSRRTPAYDVPQRQF